MRLSFSLSVLKEFMKKKPLSNKVLARTLVKPIIKRYLVKTKDFNKPTTKQSYGQLQRQRHNQQEKIKMFHDANAKGLLNDFPVAPIDATIKTAKRARIAFDKVYYPLKTIVPPNLVDKFGMQSAVFKTYQDKPNCIRYYTKNKYLNAEQCKILHEDDGIRSVFGYEINNQKMTKKMFATYIGWIAENVDDLYDDEEDAIEYEAYKEMSSALRTNPDGSRSPMVIQMGMNSYMDRNMINNPVKIIDTHVTQEKLKIYDYTNLGKVLAEVNISSQEAFDYVCKYLNKNRNIKRKHTEDRELTRGASALKNLIDFYKAEVSRTTTLKMSQPKTKVFGYKELMNGEQYKAYCKQTGEPQLRQYESFKKWIRKRLNSIANIK